LTSNFQIEEKTKELRQRIQVLTSEVEVLRQEKKSQEALCQSVILQKEMLKHMLETSNSTMNESMEVIEQPQVCKMKLGDIVHSVIRNQMIILQNKST
jgi:hypothetical protein